MSGFAFTGGADMTPDIAKGAVLTNGVLKAVAAGTVTIGAADATNPRIDLVAAHSRSTSESPVSYNYQLNTTAVAELGGFSQAARALNVTHAAVAQQGVALGGSPIGHHLAPGPLLFHQEIQQIELDGEHLGGKAPVGFGIAHARGGTYVVMEGPQFSTLAESELYRTWNCDVIGMTNMPEAKLAREAELCYASVAMVTDYDCWHPDHDDVTVEQIVAVLVSNAGKARSLVTAVAPRIYADQDGPDCACGRSLEHALITAPEQRRPEIIRRLDAVAGRVLNK